MRTTMPEDAATSATSAKRAQPGLVNGRSTSNLDNADDYQALNEPWLNDKVTTCAGVELKQDENVLMQEFSWAASAQVDEQFDALAISEDKAKKAAGIRATGTSTGYEAPSNFKNLGISHPLLDIYHQNATKIQFSGSCPWFGQTDSFHEARKHLAMGDCLADGEPKHPD